MPVADYVQVGMRAPASVARGLGDLCSAPAARRLVTAFSISLNETFSFAHV